MVWLPIVITKRISDTFIFIRNQCSLYRKGKKIHLTITLHYCLPKTLYLHSEWANCPNLHPEKNQLKIKLFRTTKTRWFNRLRLLGHMLLPRSLLLSMHQTLTTLDYSLTRHKEKHKNGKKIILYERWQKRITILYYIWQ